MTVTGGLESVDQSKLEGFIGKVVGDFGAALSRRSEPESRRATRGNG